MLDDKRGELYIKKICLKVPDLSMFRRKVKRAELNENKKADAELHNEHLNNDLLRNIFNRNPNLKTAGSEILKNVRAKSTLTAYGRVVKDFKQFCGKNEYSFVDPNEQSVVHFILSMEFEKVGFPYITKIKPALSLHYSLKNGGKIFTEYVENMLRGAKKLAAERKPLTKKPEPFPLMVLKSLVAIYILPFETDIMRINAEAFRSIFRAVIMYFTFCRFNCFKKLKEENFQLRENSIFIDFASAKNDQLHKGNISTLLENGSHFCPVRITKMYFKRFHLKFGVGTKFVNFRLEKQAGIVKAKPYESLSYSSAMHCTRKLMLKNGFSIKGISEKSAKVEGVSQTANAGATLEELMWLGRWKCIQTANHYKHNSEK